MSKSRLVEGERVCRGLRILACWDVGDCRILLHRERSVVGGWEVLCDMSVGISQKMHVEWSANREWGTDAELCHRYSEMGIQLADCKELHGTAAGKSGLKVWLTRGRCMYGVRLYEYLRKMGSIPQRASTLLLHGVGIIQLPTRQKCALLSIQGLGERASASVVCPR